MSKRGQWGSRMGFIIAAIGSAIGLGNIWRFPYVATSNGGGAFMIPYIFALLTAGIPMLILEFSIAHKIKKGAPGCFGKINSKFQILGWFQSMISFGIIVYYITIIAWTINYFVFAIKGSWGTDTAGFFYNDFLEISSGSLDIGGINTKMFIALALVWIINYIVLRAGIKSGIEKANKIFMPLLIICLLIVTVRGITLEGALNGVDYFFRPDFVALKDPTVWIAAYGQIFYSISICFGIMITYASYLPDDTDIVNNAFITGLGNCSFSILAGIAVFSALGYLANVQGVSVQEVSKGGIGLAFIVFPEIINAMPSMNKLMGALFFVCLIFAGLSSSMSIMEVIVSSFSEKFKISRNKALAGITVIGFLASSIFVTGAGLYILDIVDHFINNYCIAISGIFEVIIISWYLDLEKIRGYANERSDYTVGKWWNYTLKYMTPIMLTIMFVFNAHNDFTKGYDTYTKTELFIYGGGIVILVAILAVIFNNIKGKNEYQDLIGKGVEF